jgi:hypothetical protein
VGSVLATGPNVAGSNSAEAMDTDRQNSHSFVYSSYLPQISAGSTARELWWTSPELSLVGIIITVALHAQISPGGMNSRSTGGRSSDTWSHPIKINQST